MVPFNTMNKELIYGIHALKSRIKVHPDSIRCLYFLKGKAHTLKVQELLTLAKRKQVAFESLTKSAFNQLLQDHALSDEIVHQYVLADCVSAVKLYAEADIPRLLQARRSPPLILVLDGVHDPHNLGACIRTAEAAGVDFVIFPKDKSVGINAVVQKVACGAAERVRLVVATNISRVLKQLQSEGIWIVGMAGEAVQSLYELDLRIPTALVMGIEGTGLRVGTRKACDYLAQLPMCGEVSSLNISVATGIGLYEALRQRQR